MIAVSLDIRYYCTDTCVCDSWTNNLRNTACFPKSSGTVLLDDCCTSIPTFQRREEETRRRPWSGRSKSPTGSGKGSERGSGGGSERGTRSGTESGESTGEKTWRRTTRTNEVALTSHNTFIFTSATPRTFNS